MWTVTWRLDFLIETCPGLVRQRRTPVVDKCRWTLLGRATPSPPLPYVAFAGNPGGSTRGYAAGVQQALSARSREGLAAAWARGVQAGAARVAGSVFVRSAQCWCRKR